MVCRLMLVCPVNHGDIQTILVGIVHVSLRTAWALSQATMEATMEALPVEEPLPLPVSPTPGGDGAWMSQLPDAGAGRPGSVPFVSHRPGAYGRLLLAVYVRWKTGILVASDWLHPVTRGGAGGGWGGLAGGPTSHRALCG